MRNSWCDREGEPSWRRSSDSHTHRQGNARLWVDATRGCGMGGGDPVRARSLLITCCAAAIASLACSAQECFLTGGDVYQFCTSSWCDPDPSVPCKLELSKGTETITIDISGASDGGAQVACSSVDLPDFADASSCTRSSLHGVGVETRIGTELRSKFGVTASDPNISATLSCPPDHVVASQSVSACVRPD